jgi:hypothetical protein
VLPSSSEILTFGRKYLFEISLAVAILVGLVYVQKKWSFVEPLSAYAPLGAIVVFIWGLFKFSHSNELSFKRPFWEKQLELYTEATSAAAILCSASDEDDWAKAKKEFLRLYFGPLCLVESDEVAGAMKLIKTELDSTNFAERNVSILKSLCFNLGIECRKSVNQGLKLSLDKITRGN